MTIADEISPSVNQRQFYTEMRELREHLDRKIDDKHTSLRESMETNFGRLTGKLDLHIQDDNRVAERVTIIETQRGDEAQQSTKRGALLALTMSAALTGGIEVIKRIFR